MNGYGLDGFGYWNHFNNGSLLITAKNIVTELMFFSDSIQTLIKPEIWNRFPNGIETERKSEYWEHKSQYQQGEVKNNKYPIDYQLIVMLN